MAADLPFLQRTSTGLTPAHRQLIEMLAGIAVADFLAESDNTTEAPVGEHQEVAR